MAEAQTHLCAVALAEDEGFLICPTWDTAEEGQQHNTLPAAHCPWGLQAEGATACEKPFHSVELAQLAKTIPPLAEPGQQVG